MRFRNSGVEYDLNKPQKKDVEAKYADSRALVTGSSGFVAPYLIRKLLDVGVTVYGIDRHKARSVDTMKRIGDAPDEKLHIVSADLNDISSLARAIDMSEPEHIFHLAAQSFVPESFVNPVATMQVNALGTANLLEAIRFKDSNASIVLAGSSEEYGLVIHSEKQWDVASEKYGHIFPEPVSIPEVPIKETNPLRPMSPYAVSKIAADHLMRNYYLTYGMRTIVSRAFNHEGAGRGDNFVTSVIARQVMEVVYHESKSIKIGDVTPFRDWSHVKDIVDGYLLLSTKGKPGEVYNQGSARTNSVLSFILLSLDVAGHKPLSMKSMKGRISVDVPSEISVEKRFGLDMPLTRVDQMLLDCELGIGIENKGLIVTTENEDIRVDFDPARFRPSDVPILLADTSKIKALGYSSNYELTDIIKDQLNYYLNPEKREIATSA
jgi:GDPmannose 4,6-dehydratase